MLAEIMRLKQGIAVAGTHGKTTTTSLTGMVLTEAGFDPTIVVGGRVRILGTNARLGKGDFLVAEADEYDRSFLELTPVVAVVTNIEADHLDTYRDLADILDAFATFANRVPFYGAVVACLDDAGVREILPRVKRRVVTYGESPDANLRASEIRLEASGTTFEVWEGRTWSSRDGAAASCRPAQRRQRARGDRRRPGAVDPVSDDRAGLEGLHGRRPPVRDQGGARRRARRRRLRAPPDGDRGDARGRAAGLSRRGASSRSSSRTSTRARATSRASSGGRSLACDVAIVTDVYPSREKPLPGVTGDLVAQAARRAGHADVIYVSDKKEVVGELERVLKPGDLLVTMGAGDVVRLGEAYLAGVLGWIASRVFLRRGRVLPQEEEPAPDRPGRARSPRSFVLGGSGLYRFLGGSLFALQRFDISGNERARTEEILKALEPWRASNLVTLDLAPLAGRLAAPPWIERVTLSKKFPDGLSVRVAERQSGRLYCGKRGSSGGSTPDGQPIAPYDPRADRDRVRARDRRARRSAGGRRSARRPSRRATRIFLRALRNCCAPGRRFRYDGFDLPKAGSCSSVRRSGEDSRALESARVSLRVAGGRRGPSIFVLRIGSCS